MVGKTTQRDVYGPTVCHSRPYVDRRRCEISLSLFVRVLACLISAACVYYDMGDVLPLESVRSPLTRVDSTWHATPLTPPEGTAPMDTSSVIPSSHETTRFILNDQQELSLWDSDVQDDDLSRLANCHDVKVLDLGRTQLSDAGLPHLVPLTSLKTLVLYKTKITGSGVKQLATMTQLTMLDLESTMVDDAGVSHLTQLTHLIGLNLAFSRVKNVSYLAAFPELLDLNLSKTGTTLNGVQSLSTLQKLTSLNLSKTKLRSDWFRHLIHFKKLKELNMGCTRIQDEHMEDLCHLQTLRRLLLFNTAISNDGIRALLSPGPGLRFNLLVETDRKTGVQSCIVSFGVDAEDKCPLTSLQELDLSGCRIYDRGLEMMTSFTNLTSLDLGHNSISDHSHDVLKSLASKLTELNLIGNLLSDDLWTSLTTMTTMT